MTRTRRSLRTFLIRNQLLLALCLSSILSCSTTAPIPKWEGKLWAGDSARRGITRAQENQHIDASDPAFDSYLSMTYADFRSFYATYVLGCKQWRDGTPMMGPDEALSRFQMGMNDLSDEAKAEVLKGMRK